MLISFIKLGRTKDVVFNFTLKFSKNTIFVTGLIAISDESAAKFICESFLALIFYNDITNATIAFFILFGLYVFAYYRIKASF